MANQDSSLDFKTRCQPDQGNLLFSYTVQEDKMAAEVYGYRFLGVGRDKLGGEVHVFLMHDLDADIPDPASASEAGKS